jgi:hypothetical protein
VGGLLQPQHTQTRAVAVLNEIRIGFLKITAEFLALDEIFSAYFEIFMFGCTLGKLQNG